LLFDRVFVLGPIQYLSYVHDTISPTCAVSAVKHQSANQPYLTFNHTIVLWISCTLYVKPVAKLRTQWNIDWWVAQLWPTPRGV